MLNFLYTLLAREVMFRLKLSSLDPYLGFLHMDSNRRPSLVFDLMEEFRAPIVDRVVTTFVVKKRINRDTELSGVREDLYENYLRRLATKVTYEKRSMTLSEHIRNQIRKVSLYLKGYIDEYTPFIVRW